MARTLKRELCSLCLKKNLCTFIGTNGKEYSKCQTANCINSNTVESVVQELGDVSKNSATIVNDLRNNSINIPLENITEKVSQESLYRGISKIICNHLGITIYEHSDLIASYKHTNIDGTIDIKYRWVDKKFSWPIKGETTTLFALDKCTDFNKPLCITEGNEDCATLWELGYQACSLLSAGSESAIKNQLKHSLDYINKFSSIIIATDIDHTTAVVRQTLLNVLHHKQCFTVDFSPYKDANECFVTDKELLIQKLKDKHEILPSGLIQGNQLDFKKLKEQIVRSIPLPWPGLNNGLNGLEYGCLYVFLAGTSTGKSTVLRELAYWYRNNLPELKIANFFFEENEDVTPLAYLALEMNIPLGTLRREINIIEQEKYEKAKLVINTENLMFINKDFSKSINNLLQQIEYLVIVKKYELIIIDHISYIIGRSGTSQHGERIDIDNFLYKLQDLTQRLGCIIVAVSHVNESTGTKRWDEGEIPNIYSGRGSKALAQVPDGIIGLARNITSEYDKSVLSLYNLKNRWHSNTGKTDDLVYIEKTGRLVLK